MRHLVIYLLKCTLYTDIMNTDKKIKLTRK